ncbi:MAG: hypothetical protein VW943_07170 [Flavobacteriaceae bacterium]
MYSVAEGGAGSGLDCSISEFVTSCVSSTVFLGGYFALGSATVLGGFFSAGGAVFDLD